MLSKLISGKISKPPLICIYGGEGIGKSTFAAGFESDGMNVKKSQFNLSPVVIDAEDSTAQLDTTRWTANEFPHHRNVIDAISSLLKEEHSHKALVVDSIDWLETLIFNDIATAAGKKTIADIPYGVGYKESVSIMWHILNGLKKLRDDKGMAIILVGHGQVKKYDDPVNESYDRHELKLYAGNSQLVIEWAEAVLFATQEVFIENKEKRFNRTINKGKAGDRIICTTEQPAFRAKNRFNLPEQLPLSWDALVTAMKGN